MAIQDTIIEALKTVQAAHSGALTAISKLRSERSALEAEVARLNSQIAGLKTHVAHLEAESVNIVDPDSVRSLLASLAQIVVEGQHANVSAHGSRGKITTEEFNGLRAPYMLQRNGREREGAQMVEPIEVELASGR